MVRSAPLLHQHLHQNRPQHPLRSMISSISPLRRRHQMSLSQARSHRSRRTLTRCSISHLHNRPSLSLPQQPFRQVSTATCPGQMSGAVTPGQLPRRLRRVLRSLSPRRQRRQAVTSGGAVSLVRALSLALLVASLLLPRWLRTKNLAVGRVARELLLPEHPSRLDLAMMICSPTFGSRWRFRSDGKTPFLRVGVGASRSKEQHVGML